MPAKLRRLDSTPKKRIAYTTRKKQTHQSPQGDGILCLDLPLSLGMNWFDTFTILDLKAPIVVVNIVLRVAI